MPGLGLQWAAGNAGAQDVLQKMMAERKAVELMKQQQAQQQFENQMKQQELASLDKFRTAQVAPEPEKGVVIDGRLVSPTSAKVMGDFRDPDAGANQYLKDELANTRELEQIRARAEETRANRVPTQGPQPQMMYDAQGNLKAYQFSNGAFKEIPLPTGLSEKPRPNPEENVADLYAAERQDRMRTSVTDLKKKVNEWTVGYGALLDGVPRTDALAFDSEVTTLKANIGFKELAEMRQASKTGGALGQVSDMENKLLQNAIAALNTKQTPAQFNAQLDKVLATLDRWEAAKAKYASRQLNQGEAMPKVQGAPGGGFRVLSVEQ